eukprot:scaffold13709_cov54-Cylindrotheca_fusiformis.AAC.1
MDDMKRAINTGEKHPWIAIPSTDTLYTRIYKIMKVSYSQYQPARITSLRLVVTVENELPRSHLSLSNLDFFYSDLDILMGQLLDT